ncbi:deoxyribodipyrimidine photo-lyase [Methanobacterium congolense]|uniref:Deoxyribodipyrimidine photo-lyase n=1 Tax=Methanobacterium congolense TaxID=118062 RepID=A0A1D3L070_9EURY|nr:deoxyribodipyrimidine photo-lyase [Methanobacterium congolense]SCG84933.1 Deoxyribodipyrimidine photo-lyase [Methanobacterium congolense]
MIQAERIKKLNEKPLKDGEYVLYWMQSSQRAHQNHALEYAVSKANQIHKPLVIYFGLTENYPEANLRHYTFMLEGLKDLKTSLIQRNIKFLVLKCSPDVGAMELSKRASMVVVDRGYLEEQVEWYKNVLKTVECPFVQVESNVVVPVEVASFKEEYSAATFRRRIKLHIEKFLVLLKEVPLEKSSVSMEIPTKIPEISLDDVDEVLSGLEIDLSVPKTEHFHGGTSVAIKLLEDFVENKLDGFAEFRNDPSMDHLSNMSPYLHFGQISPVHIALRVNDSESSSKDAFLEEIIIRRELAVNFVHYNPNYKNMDALPDWALKTLKEHEDDRRKYVYTLQEFETASTHDPYWNAAQMEMVKTGKMHGYMRMYWGKKILEWTENPQKAFEIAIRLNNKYELDGRDPNGYTGVLWCFGKHDRAWKEREIFGKVRYMNAKGLKRKFKIDSYVERVNSKEP